LEIKISLRVLSSLPEPTERIFFCPSQEEETLNMYDLHILVHKEVQSPYQEEFPYKTMLSSSDTQLLSLSCTFRLLSQNNLIFPLPEVL